MLQNHKLISTALLAAGVASFALFQVACKDGAGVDFRNKVIDGVGSATGQQRFTGAAKAGAKALDTQLLTPDDENAMGQSVAVSMTNSYTLTKDKALNKYVSLVGMAVVNASSRPVGNWVFGVLESDDVNAFAGPNGYIFVTTGALSRMEDESELAGVLAHEVTHVLHHHGMQAVRTGALADAGGKALKVFVDDRTGLVNQLADPTVDVIAKKGYGKAQELDADRTAIALVSDAGYDPGGLVRFLKRLQGQSGDLFSTHPGKEERVQKANAQIAKLGAKSGKTMKDRFAKNVK